MKNLFGETIKPEQSYSIEDFREFWLLYPKKTTKQEVLIWWKKNVPRKYGANMLMKALKKQIESKKALKQAEEFAPAWPDAIRWLKKGRFTDEIKPPKKIKRKFDQEKYEENFE